MRRAYIIVGGLILLLAIGRYMARKIDFNFQIAKTLVGEPPAEEAMYPPSPTDITACVSTPLSELLSRYENAHVELGVDIE
jgi:hypothetical protein